METTLARRPRPSIRRRRARSNRHGLEAGLTPDARTLALGMAIYPVLYGCGAALVRRGRRARLPVPSVRDAKRVARRETRRALKRERREIAQ